ncbi:MAG TPA: CoA-binding protein [Bacillota bacterium]|nr:CoA-binding protein [Bacillota bacterium]
MKNPSNEKITQILKEAKTIAVVGLSSKSDRTSHQVSQAMQHKGYRIIPVNPNEEEVLGEKAYPSLREVPEDIDIINVFRRSEDMLPIAEEAATLNAPTFWMQQGIQNEEAYELLTSQGKTVIMDLCIKVAESVLLKS